MPQNRFPSVSEDTIAVLIDAFYAKVRRHTALGPVFEAAIAAEEWSDHLEVMRRFWSSVLLASGRYAGNPVAVHRAVFGIEPPLFAIWLALFTETAAELFEPGPASEFSTKAHRIATSLQLALFHRLDRPPEGLSQMPAA